MLEIALVENVQRKNLNPMERASAFLRLRNEFRLTVTEISERVGKSISFVSNNLNLLNLPDVIKDGLSDGKITEGHARALLQIKNEKDMLVCYHIILKEKASVRRAEHLARYFNEKISEKAKEIVADDLQINLWQNRIQQSLKSKTLLKLSRSKKSTRIVITLSGNIEKTEKDFQKIINTMTEKL
jgi:ParB family chromosome partitioning protein